MVHQIAWIMSALNLPLPVSAYMSGGVFSEKDGRQVPDTIAVTLDFPNDLVVTWQSTFSNSNYGLGERILGSDGTIEHLSGVNDMVTGSSEDSTRYYPEKVIARIRWPVSERLWIKTTWLTGLTVCEVARPRMLRSISATDRQLRRTWQT